MKRNTQPSESLTAYIDSLLQISGQLTLILHHMWEHEGPESELGPYETLANLIEGVIPPRYAQRDEHLKLATKLIAATSNAIADDIFLVADEPPPDDAGANGAERLH